MAAEGGLELLLICNDLMYCAHNLRGSLVNDNFDGARTFARIAGRMCAEYPALTGVEELPWAAAQRGERLALARARRNGGDGDDGD